VRSQQCYTPDSLPQSAGGLPWWQSRTLPPPAGGRENRLLVHAGGYTHGQAGQQTHLAAHTHVRTPHTHTSTRVRARCMHKQAAACESCAYLLSVVLDECCHLLVVARICLKPDVLPCQLRSWCMCEHVENVYVCVCMCVLIDVRKHC
jgi:hypothetical protein